MQSSSSGRPFKPGLVGASPTTDASLWLNANCPRSSDRLERGSAKAEVAGAIPAVDAISQDCGVTSSISPCEGDGPGANPGFLTIFSRRGLHVITSVATLLPMVVELKLRKVGNSVGLVLPKEALARLNVEEGDAVYLTETTDGGFRVTANNPEFAEKMKVAERLSRRYRNALKELAK